MNVKLTYSNGDSQVVPASKVAFWLLGRESINKELTTPITLAKIEEVK